MDARQPDGQPNGRHLTDDHLQVANEDDIVAARQRAREAARQIGFGPVDQSRIATAVSELTRNVVRYATAGRGEVRIRTISDESPVGLEIVVSDDGPGIANVEAAMRAGFTSGPGLGMGLPGNQAPDGRDAYRQRSGPRHGGDHSQVATMIDPSQVQVAIAEQLDVEHVRREGRSLAMSLGFDAADVERVGLAVAELAINLLRYAEHGEIGLSALDGPGTVGVQVHSRDVGPGIVDIQAALRDGFGSVGSLGSGLPGARRLMDEFELTSGPSGTTVICRKWRRLT